MSKDLINNENTLDYKKINSFLINWISIIDITSKFYKELFFEDNLNSEIKEKSSPVFFNLIFDFFLENIIINIFSITDNLKTSNKYENLTIRILINNPEIANNNEFKERYNNHFNKLFELIDNSNLVDWRHKIIAHRDLNTALDSNEKISTTLDKIIEIIENLKFIISEYNHDLLKTAIHWDYNYNEYIKNNQTSSRICDLLKKGIEYERNFS